MREKLRRVYGLFREESELKNRRELAEELFEKKHSPLERKKLITQILATHSSTKERLSFYPQLYQEIFKITGKPKSIIDLGCGINPFSIEFMDLNLNLNLKLSNQKPFKYYAYDLSEDEINLLNQYFHYLNKELSKKKKSNKKQTEKKEFHGKAEILDLLHFAKLTQLDSVDICFLFKVTDVLDQGKNHKISEAVIKNVPAKYVVVSFPIMTMSGKLMNHPRRKWIELMCQRLNYEIKLVKMKNEIFYVIKK